MNATYVNAYAFPGGSIACTRGIMLSLDNEAELGALLGHELGHVNARHTAEQMSKGALTQAVVGGLSVLAGSQGAVYGQLASQLGGWKLFLRAQVRVRRLVRKGSSEILTKRK